MDPVKIVLVAFVVGLIVESIALRMPPRKEARRPPKVTSSGSIPDGGATPRKDPTRRSERR